MTFPPQCPYKKLKTIVGDTLVDDSLVYEKGGLDEISEDWEVTDATMVFKELIFFFTWTMINLFILFSEAISFTGFIISSCDFNIVSRASPLSELLLDVGLSFSSSTTSPHAAHLPKGAAGRGTSR